MLQDAVLHGIERYTGPESQKAPTRNTRGLNTVTTGGGGEGARGHRDVNAHVSAHFDQTQQVLCFHLLEMRSKHYKKRYSQNKLFLEYKKLSFFVGLFFFWPTSFHYKIGNQKICYS